MNLNSTNQSSFDPGLNIFPTTTPLGFRLGENTFGPQPEIRTLDAIRPSLQDPNCTGPDEVYAIMMDVGKPSHHNDLLDRHLLFGVVTYATGQLGQEPIRSQGHTHAKNPRNGVRTPEVYEIWQGRAVILMQEKCIANDSDAGQCYAIEAGPGQVVIVPPGWAHATISADPSQPLTFGAWCDRDYAFDYDDVRAHNGLAFFPKLNLGRTLQFEHNPTYQNYTELIRRPPRPYTELKIDPDIPIYLQYEQSPSRFDFVPNPDSVHDAWTRFIP
ncbi:glucose-6-phosphate isomerase family protein [Poriferisphaera sp. WC338]|uniref:glucose-6-phosphate isomerase family protein n=1 Tax=Poriferisphaera sp. WC338 TaxID=3425129 RepID=UPI003D813A78